MEVNRVQGEEFSEENIADVRNSFEGVAVQESPHAVYVSVQVNEELQVSVLVLLKNRLLCRVNGWLLSLVLLGESTGEGSA